MLSRVRQWLFPRVETTVVEADLEAGTGSELNEKADAASPIKPDEKPTSELTEDVKTGTEECASLPRPSHPPGLTLIYQDDEIEVWAEKPEPPTPLARTATHSSTSSSCGTLEAGIPPPKPRRFWDFAWVRILLVFLTISLYWVGLVAMGLWNAL